MKHFYINLLQITPVFSGNNPKGCDDAVVSNSCFVGASLTSQKLLTNTLAFDAEVFYSFAHVLSGEPCGNGQWRSA